MAKWAGRKVEAVKGVVLKHLVLLLLLQRYIYRVAQYSLIGKCTSYVAHIGRKGEIKILNSKIKIFSRKSRNQGTTAELNKVELKYTCRN